jgi:hypothetical protein
MADQSGRGGGPSDPGRDLGDRVVGDADQDLVACHSFGVESPSDDRDLLTTGSGRPGHRATHPALTDQAQHWISDDGLQTRSSFIPFQFPSGDTRRRSSCFTSILVASNEGPPRDSMAAFNGCFRL